MLIWLDILVYEDVCFSKEKDVEWSRFKQIWMRGAKDYNMNQFSHC
jgi:hypothetical protein